MASEVALPQGLTSEEARQRLAQFGPNAVAEARPHPWRVFLSKFWAPVPWMLEATVPLQLALGKWDEALVIAALIWAAAVAAAGYAFSNALEALLPQIRHYEEYLFIGVLVVGILVWLIRRARCGS